MVLLAVFGLAWMIALVGVAYTTCRRHPSGKDPAQRHKSSRSRMHGHGVITGAQAELDPQVAQQQQHTVCSQHLLLPWCSAPTPSAMIRWRGRSYLVDLYCFHCILCSL